MFVVTWKSYSFEVVDQLGDTEREQCEAGGQEQAQRVVREHHPHDLHAVAPRVVDRVELRLARALAVLDRDVLHRVAAGQECHRHRGDAREAGREVAQVLTGDVGAERAEARVEVGDLRLGEEARELRMNHLAGTRRLFIVPSSVVRAPTTWSYPSSSLTSCGIVSFGYVMSTSVQTVTRPRGRSSAGFARRTGAAVLQETDDAHVGKRQRELAGTVRRSVVDDDNLVAVIRRVHCSPNAIDFLPEVLDLVVHGQDDRHVERVGTGARRPMTHAGSWTISLRDDLAGRTVAAR